MRHRMVLVCMLVILLVVGWRGGRRRSRPITTANGRPYTDAFSNAAQS